jgi:hypothetical protein
VAPSEIAEVRGSAVPGATAGGPAPDRAYLDLLEGVSFQPIFIIGDHRSGTTLLYQLLSRTGAFNVLTAYHVIRYDEVLANHLNGRTAEAARELADYFAREGLADRVIDGVRVTPDLPEEYGFLFDGASRPQTTPATLPRLVELARKVRFTGIDAPVLLKNPWDVLQFAYLHQAFPAARFVFIHRHPLHVMTSQVQATRSLFRARNGYVALLSPWYRRLFERPLARWVTSLLGTSRFGIGPRIAGRHVTRVARYYTDHLRHLPTDRYVEIRYEDLCRDADATLGRVLDFLEVQARTPFSARDLVQPRPSRVSQEIRDAYEKIRAALASYCLIQGYDRDQ